jgi:hypothetical protein
VAFGCEKGQRTEQAAFVKISEMELGTQEGLGGREIVVRALAAFEFPESPHLAYRARPGAQLTMEKLRLACETASGVSFQPVQNREDGSTFASEIYRLATDGESGDFNLIAQRSFSIEEINELEADSAANQQRAKTTLAKLMDALPDGAVRLASKDSSPLVLREVGGQEAKKAILGFTSYLHPLVGGLRVDSTRLTVSFHPDGTLNRVWGTVPTLSASELKRGQATNIDLERLADQVYAILKPAPTAKERQLIGIALIWVSENGELRPALRVLAGSAKGAIDSKTSEDFVFLD